jgi:hypothetical protein
MNMNSRVLLIAAALLNGCARQDAPSHVAWIDRPLRATSEGEARRTFFDGLVSLPDGDQIAFDRGYTYLHLLFTEGTSDHLKSTEQERAFVTALNGLTPRQIALLGLCVEMQRLKYPEPDAYADGLDSEARKRREEHMQEHRLFDESIAVTALRRLSGQANQTPEPTAPSGRGSP